MSVPMKEGLPPRGAHLHRLIRGQHNRPSNARLCAMWSFFTWPSCGAVLWASTLYIGQKHTDTAPLVIACGSALFIVSMALSIAAIWQWEEENIQRWRTRPRRIQTLEKENEFD